MNGRTTYGDLVRDTSHAMAVAHGHLVSASFPTQVAALRAIEAYRDMAAALGSLGWRLIHGPGRLTVLPRPPVAPEELQPALRVCDVLTGVGHPKPWVEQDSRSVEPVVQAWGRGAVLARTAHDLLATYWDTGGAPTAPSSERLEHLDQRLAGARALGDQAGVLADGAETLALKAVQAGVDPEQCRLLADGGHALRRAVEDMHLAAAGSPTPVPGLDGLEVARPTVRTDDPLVELGDRVTRLHRFAWQLTTQRHVGAATLGNYAVAGCLIATTTGRVLQRVADQPDGPVAAPWAQQELQTLERVSATWYTIYRRLGQLRSPTPGMPGVRADITRIREILDTLGGGTDRDPAILCTLLGATRAFHDVARWNQAVLDRHAATGELLLRGQDLPRDLLSDDRNLANAKLTATTVPVPAVIVRDISRAYEHILQQPTESRSHRAGGLPPPAPRPAVS